NEFTAGIPEYRRKLEVQFNEAIAWLDEHGIEVSASRVFDLLQPKTAVDVLAALLRTLVATFSNVLLVLVIMLFMLFEADHLRKKLEAGLGAHVNLSRLDEAIRDVQRFLGIKTLTSAATGICTYGLLVTVGVQFSLLWSLLIFLFNYIPVIGSTAAALPPIILSLIDQRLGAAVGLTVGYLVINIGISNFIEPWIMGHSLGLSPLVVFLSLVFWSWIWGPLGMLLAVPVTMIIKIALYQTDDLRWVAIAMGGRIRKPPAPG
ncbi:MAG: AI-2E family transporter, partial [Planctomycetes bacterium]|nr:AI-2E family transporter [Planctomycetota bacterium]